MVRARESASILDGSPTPGVHIRHESCAQVPRCWCEPTRALAPPPTLLQEDSACIVSTASTTLISSRRLEKKGVVLRSVELPETPFRRRQMAPTSFKALQRRLNVELVPPHSTTRSPPRRRSSLIESTPRRYLDGYGESSRQGKLQIKANPRRRRSASKPAPSTNPQGDGLRCQKRSETIGSR